MVSPTSHRGKCLRYCAEADRAFPTLAERIPVLADGEEAIF